MSKILVEHITGEPWIRFIAAPERVFTPEQFLNWEAAAERLIFGEPIQYVTGKAWFGNLELSVGPGVLIPRPETEELVEWIVADSPLAPLSILDIGTGSGCIAVSLAHSLPLAEVTALDTSALALDYAGRNAHKYAPQVKLVQLDILAQRPEGGPRYQVIVSNPPYIPHADAADMSSQVLDHEPGLALFVPDEDPLRYYIKVSELALHWLYPGGLLYFEIHENYGEEIYAMLQAAGFEDVELRKDLSGKDRMVRAKRPK